MGVDDILNLGCNIDTVSKDIIDIANFSKNVGAKQTSFFYQVSNSNKFLCQNHGYRFIDNSNVSSEKLWQEGLHLNNSGKDVLHHNYVVTPSDNYFFRFIFYTATKIIFVNLTKMLV